MSSGEASPVPMRTESLWRKTDKVALTRVLKQWCAKHPDDVVAAKQLAARESNPAYVIEVKRIGVHPRDPSLRERIEGKWLATQREARAEARRKLKPMDDEEAFAFVFGDDWESMEKRPTRADAITRLAETQDTWKLGFDTLVRDYCVHGLVGGEAEYDRLHDLGAGDLLVEAVSEIQRFNRLAPDTGEG